MKEEMKEKLEAIWYSRNPVHEINADTGKDMFFDTVLMVFNDFTSTDLTTLRSRVKELEESKFTRLDLERAHIAGWNNIDFEDWYQSELPPTK